MMGIMPQQALEMANQMGLSTMDATLTRGQQSMEAALGLQRLGFGGARESGAFLRAERRGGIQGVQQGPGGAARAINETIGRAMAMGLDRSETRDLLNQIATGQDRFFSTGVPFARQSIMDLTEGLGGALGEGLRSMRAAQQIAQGAQMVGGQGPQNAAQAMLIREVARSRGFGFSNEGIFRAMSELEQGLGPTGQEVSGLMGRFRTGGGFTGAFAQKQILQGAFPGMSLTARDAGRIGARGIAPPGTTGAGFDVGAQAIGRAAGIEQTRAGQELMRIGIGQEMAPAVQTFEKAMIKTGGAFAKMAPSVTKIAQGAEAVADILPAFTGAVQNFIGAFGDEAEVQKMKDKIKRRGLMTNKRSEAEKKYQPGFQGSETSGVEVSIYPHGDDPIISDRGDPQGTGPILLNGRFNDAGEQTSITRLSYEFGLGDVAPSWSLVYKDPSTDFPISTYFVDDDWIDISLTRHGEPYHLVRGILDGPPKLEEMVANDATSRKLSTFWTGIWPRMGEGRPIYFNAAIGEIAELNANQSLADANAFGDGAPSTLVDAYLFHFLRQLQDSTVGTSWEFPGGIPNIDKGSFFSEVVDFQPEGSADAPERFAVLPNFYPDFSGNKPLGPRAAVVRSTVSTSSSRYSSTRARSSALSPGRSWLQTTARWRCSCGADPSRTRTIWTRGSTWRPWTSPLRTWSGSPSRGLGPSVSTTSW